MERIEGKGKRKNEIRQKKKTKQNVMIQRTFKKEKAKESFTDKHPF